MTFVEILFKQLSIFESTVESSIEFSSITQFIQRLTESNICVTGINIIFFL